MFRLMQFLSCFCLAILIFIGGLYAQPRKIYVDSDILGGNGDGSGWLHAYRSLSLAITNSSKGDSIFVKAGTTYIPATSGLSDPREATFHLLSERKIYGGFSGTETTLSARTPGLKSTLSGDIGVLDDASDNCYTVVYIDYLQDEVVLDGFVITGGNSNQGSGRYSHRAGGGIYLESGTVLLQNLEIHNNAATQSGGGGYIRSGGLVNSVIYNNTSSREAGGIFVENGYIYNSIFYGNVGEDGGGVALSGGGSVVNCTLHDNTATVGGGGLYIGFSSDDGALFANTIVYGNTASSEANGHNIYNRYTKSGAQGIQFAHNLVEGADKSAAIKGRAATNNEEAHKIRVIHTLYTSSSPFASETKSESNYLRLSASSVALQRGNNRLLPTTLTLDLSNGPRIREFNIDIGAYEGTYVGQKLYVDGSASANGNGQSWATAYDSLHKAFLAASSTDSIFVRGDRVYRPNTKGLATPRKATFHIPLALKVYGGFSGTETSLKARTPGAPKSILSGDIGVLGTRSDNTYHVIYMDQTSSHSVLDGFIIEEGNANGEALDASGGGGRVLDAHVRLQNVAIRRNSAVGGGGGLDMRAGKLMGAAVYQNTARYGGGIYLEGGRIVNASIFDNQSIGLEGGGGGVYVSLEAPDETLVANSILYGNQSAHATLGHQLYNNKTATSRAGSTQDLGITLSHNLFQGHDADESIKSRGAALRLTNNRFTTSIPFKSLNSRHANFLRLRTSSGGIDAGDTQYVNDATTAYDFSGQARIQGAHVDIGAREGEGFGDAVYYVASDVGKTNGDGQSWANAYDSLHKALAVAQVGDSVFVKEGTYRPAIQGLADGRKGSFNLKGGSIYGGFSGTESSLKEREGTSKSILSGDIGAENNTSDNSYHVVSVPSSVGAAELAYFTIQGGHANGEDIHAQGGGVRGEGRASLHHLEIKDNTATLGGGAYLQRSHLTHSRLHDNTSTSNGGGVYLTGGQISHSALYDNTAPTGGGLYLATTASAVNNTLYDNEASKKGGGLYISATTEDESIVANTLLYGNTATEEGNEVYNADQTGKGAAFAHNLVKGADEASAIQGVSDHVLQKAEVVYASASASDIFASSDKAQPTFLHLKANSSPALQKGHNRYVLATAKEDLGGQARIQGLSVDIGAYEGTYSARTWFVDAKVQGGNSTGTSWADAYDSLHLALNTALASDLVFAKGGLIYTPSTAGLAKAQQATFALKSGVSVYGGFVGNETTLEARNPDAPKSTLSGSYGRHTNDRSYHVVTVPLGTENAHLEGFIITEGHAREGAAPHDRGAGIYMRGQATLNSVDIQDNDAIYGALYMENGHLTHSRVLENLGDEAGGIFITNGIIDNTEVYNNTSRHYGGIRMHGGRVEKSKIYNNLGMAEGGGMLVDGASLVKDTDIYRNSSSARVGGVHVKGGRVEDCIIRQNVANSYHGGALIEGGVVDNTAIRGNNTQENDQWAGPGGAAVWGGVLSNSRIYNNSTLGTGGGLDIAGGEVVKCVIHNNGTGVNAGGVVIWSGKLYESEIHSNANRNGYGGGISARGGEVFNNKIYNNIAYGSGGLDMYGQFDRGNISASSHVYQNLIYNNEALHGAGVGYSFGYLTHNSIYNNISTDGDASRKGSIELGGGLVTYTLSFEKEGYIANNIFYGNVAAPDSEGIPASLHGPEIYNFVTRDGGPLLSHNLIKGFSESAAVVGPANHVYEAKDNVYSTSSPFASTKVDEADYLRLGSGSPALNIGDNARISSNLKKDFGGNARIQDGVVDAGAYEARLSLTKVAWTTPTRAGVVAHNAPTGTLVGVLWAEGVSSSLQNRVTYTLVEESATQNVFVLSDDTLKVGEALPDHGAQSEHVLKIKASFSQYSLTHTETLTVRVLKPTETIAITDIIAPGRAVPDRAHSGSTISTLKAQGLPENLPVRFELIEHSAKQDTFQIQGHLLQVGHMAPNQLIKPLHTLKIKAVYGNISFVASVSIEVLRHGIEVRQGTFQLSRNLLVEGAKQGGRIGLLSIKELNTTNVAYKVIDNESKNHFQITRNELQTGRVPTSFALKPVHHIILQAKAGDVIYNATAPVQVTILPVGALKSPEATHWDAYPNPATDIIYLRGLRDEQRWRILSQEGIVLDEGRSHTLSIAQYPQGVYLLEIQSPNGNTQRRNLIKK